MIPDETVEQVRAAADVVAIIGEFVPLRRSGGSWRGPCPFHQGKNPNFSVTPSTGTYHCFVCHESGDVFTFVRKRLGLDWPAAVKLVGEKAGIEVVDVPRGRPVEDPLARHHEALTAAAEWFMRQLHEAPGSDAARAYLASRGLDEAVWQRFGIGFAPRDAQALGRYLASLGFDETLQLEAGLSMLRDGETTARARFRGRIMFPIHDEIGRPVGFGGRALGDEQPKYLNSAESAVFQKRRTLYGLHTAKQAMRRERRAIVVEGYLDRIRLALAGIEEAVAPLGTALTTEQAQLLVRYASEVFLLYDSDEAGQKATFRSGLELLQQQATVRVVSLPAGEDPDTFVRAHGAAAMTTHLQDAIDLFDRQLQLIARRGWFGDLRHARLAVDRLLPTIVAAKAPLTRALYLARLAETSGVDRDALAREADELERAVQQRLTPQRGAPQRGASGRAQRDARHADVSMSDGPDAGDAPFPERDVEAEAPLPPPPGEQRPPYRGRRGQQGPQWKVTAIPPRPRIDDPIERALVRAMLHERGVAERVADKGFPPDEFASEGYRDIFRVLLEAKPDAGFDAIAAELTGDSLRLFVDLTEASQLAPEAVDVELSIKKLIVRRIDDTIGELERRANESEDEGERAMILREKQALVKERNSVWPRWGGRTNKR
ncbi:MAG: DNA primase [Gemmatimonadetes bacterium]|nr:DNA primase [Gemmatimonadota bacterium]